MKADIKPKEAPVFMFTDWHLKGKPRNVEDWPPFATSTPPDGRTIKDLTDTVNARLAGMLPDNFPESEKVRCKYVGVGIEEIEASGEPHWGKVWGAIVDRNATGSDDNRRKLGKMAKGLRDVRPRDTGRVEVDVFITPTATGSAPDPLPWYGEAITMKNVENFQELVILITGWLASAAQTPSEVRLHMQKEY